MKNSGYIIVILKNGEFNCIHDGLYNYKEAEDKIVKLSEEDSLNGWNYDYRIYPFSTE